MGWTWDVIGCYTLDRQDTPLRGVQVSNKRDLTILERKLKTVSSLDELYGFANRRKVLGLQDGEFADRVAPRWTEDERRLILARKYELEKLCGMKR